MRVTCLRMANLTVTKPTGRTGSIKRTTRCDRSLSGTSPLRRSELSVDRDGRALFLIKRRFGRHSPLVEPHVEASGLENDWEDIRLAAGLANRFEMSQLEPF